MCPKKEKVKGIRWLVFPMSCFNCRCCTVTSLMFWVPLWVEQACFLRRLKGTLQPWISWSPWWETEGAAWSELARRHLGTERRDASHRLLHSWSTLSTFFSCLPNPRKCKACLLHEASHDTWPPSICIFFSEGKAHLSSSQGSTWTLLPCSAL